MFEAFNQTTTEAYSDPITKILDTPLKVKHTPARLAHDILAHNNETKYSQVGVVGLPGSGKTTFVNCLVHALHVKDPSYQVHHFKKEDILELDKILDKKLPKRQNVILIFDDVSYLFEQLGEKKVAEILHSLTIVREKLDPEFKATKAIVFLLFHYSFALVKGLRTTNFRIVCSVSDEEFENYRKVLGYHNSRHIFEFTKKYMSMMRYGNFKIPSNNDEPFVYKTSKPFRLALVSNMGELHYTLYHKAGCSVCLPGGKKKHEKPNISFWEEMLKAYGYQNVARVLSIYTFVNTRKPAVNKNFRAIWRQLEAEHRFSRMDLLELAKVFREANKVHGVGGTAAVAAKRQELIMSKLREMEQKALADENKLVTDSLENVSPESLQGDESRIEIDYRDDFEDDDEDDDLEGDMDGDQDMMKGAL